MGNILEDNTSNPFSDPEFKKKFLKDKGLLGNTDEDYEVLPPQDPIGSEPGKVINPVDIINRASKIPDSVGNVIHDLSSFKGKGLTERSNEIKGALNQIMTSYNEKYGLDLHLNLDSTSDMLASLADPIKFRAFELTISNLFGRFKAILYFRLMQSMYLLIDDILSPKNLLGSSMELSDKWIVLEKVSQLFMTIESFKDSMKIEGADTEMKKIGDDMTKDSGDQGDIRSQEQVKEFMDAILRKNGVST